MSADYKELLLEEMAIRSLSTNTKRAYIRSMKGLCNYFKRTADQITVKDIRAYILFMLKEKQLAPRTINREIAAYRFFFTHVMGWVWSADALPKQKAPRHVPVVLSEAEVASMIEACDNLFYKALIMLTYSSGLRQSEVRNLRVTDIDSKRMILHVRQGKGNKDRQALLSPVALKMLRDYWRLYRAQRPFKSDLLFIGTRLRKDRLVDQMSHTAMGYIFSQAAKRAGIKKKSTPIFSGIRLPHTCLSAA
jgi:integrase/recombinase XerD